jgi:hypothetical protein
MRVKYKTAVRLTSIFIVFGGSETESRSREGEKTFPFSTMPAIENA